MFPGTPLNLDWGTAGCRAEAIVVGDAHALVLSRESVSPGTQLDLLNDTTGDKGRFSVIWCSPADADGRCKLGLQIIDEVEE